MVRRGSRGFYNAQPITMHLGTSVDVTNVTSLSVEFSASLVVGFPGWPRAGFPDARFAVGLVAS